MEPTEDELSVKATTNPEWPHFVFYAHTHGRPSIDDEVYKQFCEVLAYIQDKAKWPGPGSPEKIISKDIRDLFDRFCGLTEEYKAPILTEETASMEMRRLAPTCPQWDNFVQYIEQIEVTIDDAEYDEFRTFLQIGQDDDRCMSFAMYCRFYEYIMP